MQHGTVKIFKTVAKKIITADINYSGKEAYSSILMSP
jgi:hypothetical protein